MGGKCLDLIVYSHARRLSLCLSRTHTHAPSILPSLILSMVKSRSPFASSNTNKRSSSDQSENRTLRVGSFAEYLDLSFLRSFWSEAEPLFLVVCDERVSCEVIFVFFEVFFQAIKKKFYMFVSLQLMPSPTC